MRKSPRYQKGLGAISWLLVAGIAAFFLLLAFRMVPAYMDNRYIVEVLKSLAEKNPNLLDVPKPEIEKQIYNSLLVNNVRDQAISGFKIIRKKDRILINNLYEVRQPIFANVEVVMTFNNQLDSANPDACCDYLIKEDDKK